MGSSPIATPDGPSQDTISSAAFGLSALACVLALLLFFLSSSMSPGLFAGLELVAAVLPWVVVWMQASWPERVNVMGDKSDPRANMNYVFFGSGFAMLATQPPNLQIDDMLKLGEFAAIPTLILAFALYIASPSPSSKIQKALALLVFSALYGFGGAKQADILLDKSAVQNYTTEVVRKTYTTGRGSRYYLYLEPWGPVSTVERSSVKHAFYDSVAEGGSVCITAQDGALHVPWHAVHACE
jgi:hypothetical protein